MCGSCGGNKLDNGASTAIAKENVANNIVGDCCSPRSVPQNPCVDDVKKPQQQPFVDRVPCIGAYEQHLFESPNGDICDRGPKEPYHIPGYAGHVPTIQSRAGHTFGQDSHEVLASKPDNAIASYSKGSHTCPEPMHEPYRIPGYTGHVPGLKSMVGGTYGGDTHKLMYLVQSYPNHQENLSMYRPSHGNHYGNRVSDQSGGERINGQTNGKPYNQGLQAKLPHEESLSSSYQRPKEHYYQPQFKYRIADTYATTANLTLFDPCVNEESKVVISTRELDDTQVVRTQDCLEEKVESSPYINKPIRHRPMVPGFDTFIDALRGARGQRFEFTASSPSHLKLQQQLVLQKGKVRDLPGSGGSDGRMNGSHSPGQSQECLDDLPYGYSKYGERQKYTNSALYDFTSNYRRRMSSEWAPAGISRPDPPAFDTPGEIYNQHMGLLPGYSAHVPGAMFRCGKTFTDDSRDAKKALRGDRF